MHQTHTDIGYTERQEKLIKYHVDYLKQAIRITETIEGGKKEWEGFVWNNETHWILERFLKNTDKQWHERLLRAIHRGYIQLTGNYLNLTDLVDFDILKKYLNNAQAFGRKHDVRMDSAVSMDINGWSYGYAKAMYDAGIRHFYTCIHNHHGFVPFMKKHHPFYWENEDGHKILVWHGDVYNQGNVAKLMPDVYGTVDKDGNPVTRAIINDEQLSEAKAWLDDYIESLRTQGYDYDFLPLMTKGLLVDNAPPNAHIMESLKAFNEKYGDEIEIEMVGIHTFFDIIKAKDLDLETHKGDWNDWWSDGYASTPDAVMAYKESRRNYHKLLNLKKKGYPVSETTLEALEYNLMMFSEHTWGYFTSVSEPWNKMTKKLEDRNKLFALKASELSDTLLDDVTFSDGEMAKAAGRPMRYKVLNPYPKSLTTFVKLYANWWEEFLIEKGYALKDVKSGATLEFQELRVDEKKRKEINTHMTLQPFEKRLLEIVPKKAKTRKMPLDPLFTRDETYDYVPIHQDPTVIANQYYIETPHVRIEWNKEAGIHTLFDKTKNKNLRRMDMDEGFFTPIYEKTPIEYTYKFEVPEMQSVRNDYGRNRKLISTVRDTGRLINVKVMDSGPLIARVQFKFALAGTRHCIVELKTSKASPRIDVSLIMQKDTVWEPESMYLALPFQTSTDETLYLDKAGTVIRPRIDQLPYTQSLFYTTQSGYALKGADMNLHISMPDTPLLHLGDLAPGMVKLHDGTLPNTDKQYAWLMNNYWETNFATNLGGFYRFEFAVSTTYDNLDKDALLEKTSALSKTALVYQVGHDED